MTSSAPSQEVPQEGKLSEAELRRIAELCSKNGKLAEAIVSCVMRDLLKNGNLTEEEAEALCARCARAAEAEHCANGGRIAASPLRYRKIRRDKEAAALPTESAAFSRFSKSIFPRRACGFKKG